MPGLLRDSPQIGSLLKMPRLRAAAQVLLATCGLLVESSAQASPGGAGFRTYTDADGVVHITNLKTHRTAQARGAASASRGTVPMVLLDAVVAECADLYNLPHALVKAVIATESNYNPWAVSEKGAVGLMQLMPETAREMYVADRFDPVQNIQGGTRYLRVLVNLFDGDLVKVLAAYNAGPEVVKRAQLRHSDFVVPAIPETQEYVRRVLQNYELLKAGNTREAIPWGANASRERS
jgi:soluble lytic murein transglycosylase-like protein